MVLNETAAATLFPGENPVGRRVNVNDPLNPVWREVVGVVRDVRTFDIRDGGRSAMYVPATQSAGRTYFPVLRTAGDPDALLPAVRAELRALDPALALGSVQTMEEIVRDAMAPERFVAFLLGLFAGVSLVLAVVGLYGLVSYTVGSRVRELGLRMALGAGGGSISGMVVGRCLALVGAGIVAGVAAALLLGGLLDSLLFGIGRADPLTYAAVATLLVVSAGLAAAIPAVRAARLDPAIALRAE